MCLAIKRENSEMGWWWWLSWKKKWDSEKIGKESWENFIVIEKIKLAKIRVKTINEKVIRFRIH